MRAVDNDRAEVSASQMHSEPGLIPVNCYLPDVTHTITSTCAEPCRGVVSGAGDVAFASELTRVEGTM